MKRIFILLAIWLLVALPVRAERGPVLVELFTSQGCSSCPPADALLARLAQSSDVMALALHVDYWDYLGWADEFADPSFTARQHFYANRNGKNMVYTPQMVLDGQHFVVGSNGAEVADALMARAGATPLVEIGVELDGANRVGKRRALVSLRGGAGPVEQPCDVMLALVEPQHEAEITGGENAGKKITYVNIVRDLVFLAEWNGEARRLSVPLPAKGRAAIFVQERGLGRVLGARWLD